MRLRIEVGRASAKMRRSIYVLVDAGLVGQLAKKSATPSGRSVGQHRIDGARRCRAQSCARPRATASWADLVMP
jgi:hypothetical protein